MGSCLCHVFINYIPYIYINGELSTKIKQNLSKIKLILHEIIHLYLRNKFYDLQIMKYYFWIDTHTCTQFWMHSLKFFISNREIIFSNFWLLSLGCILKSSPYSPLFQRGEKWAAFGHQTGTREHGSGAQKASARGNSTIHINSHPLICRQTFKWLHLLFTCHTFLFLSTLFLQCCQALITSLVT